eukprot:29197-Pelagococcus_subviridis.AAC.3
MRAPSTCTCTCTRSLTRTYSYKTELLERWTPGARIRLVIRHDPAPRSPSRRRPPPRTSRARAAADETRSPREGKGRSTPRARYDARRPRRRDPSSVLRPSIRPKADSES